MARGHGDGCSLCGKPVSEIRGKLIQGARGSVCRDCVEQCNSIYRAQEAGKTGVVQGNSKPVLNVPPPHEIKAFLDKYVIGQEYAKEAISVAVRNHYSRVSGQTSIPKDHPLSNVEISKSNVLLIGKSGTGKTLIAQTLARMLNVPFAMSDCTSMTAAGYVGDDCECCLARLHQASGGDLARTEIGIVYLDEVDKVARRETGPSITRDVSGEEVQNNLLRIIEGTVSSVPLHGGRKHPQGENLSINTEKILFIAGGAFNGLDAIVGRRIKGQGVLGFGNATPVSGRTDNRIEPEDLIAYGFVPEFVGRLPIIAPLRPLNKEDLLKILTQPHNAIIKQYQKLALMNGAKLSFDPDSVEEIVKVALARNTGARGLRSVLDDVMMDIQFNIRAGQDIVVTAKTVADVFATNELVA